MRRFTLNRVYIAYVAFFLLVVLGVIPRWTVPGAAVLLIAWLCLTTLEEGVLFFIRSVPLFIAVPLSAAYDNLNLWRPLALVLMARFVLEPTTWQWLRGQFISLKSRPRQWFRSHPTLMALVVLTALAGLSPVSANGRSLPLVKCGRSAPSVVIEVSVTPASRSCTVGPPPL